MDKIIKTSLFLDAMQHRYACKKYKPDAPLSDDEIAYIIECGRLSPSSFGLEHWHFDALRDRALVTDLGKACFDQEAVSTAALAIVILVRREAAYNPDSSFVHKRSERFPGGYPVFRADYEGYYSFLARENRLLHWARSQAYLACANMMTGAAAAGIDSCAIEGYVEEDVLRLLKRNAAEWAVGLIAVFGCRDEERRIKIREPAPDCATVI